MILVAFFYSIVALAGSALMIDIPAGKYLPLYSDKNKKIDVRSFSIDIYPVTNEQFLQFLKHNKKWRRSQVKKIFADSSYLKNWKSDLDFGGAKFSRIPVVSVSWFAANAYCREQGKLLPTVDQWEFVASKDREDEEAQSKIKEWYSEPTTKRLNQVGSTFKNKAGLYDLYGLIWEWTLDFNSAMVTGESRQDSTLEKNLFCGGGVAGASDFKDYAAFMRFAFRGSLKADYTTTSLGFRCARGD